MCLSSKYIQSIYTDLLYGYLQMSCVNVEFEGLPIRSRMWSIGVTIAANFDYCDSIAIGENTIAIVLLLGVYYCNSIGYIGNHIKFL